jgi:hypothetical protein
MVRASTTDRGAAEEADRAESIRTPEGPGECGQQTHEGDQADQVLSLCPLRRERRP